MLVGCSTVPRWQCSPDPHRQGEGCTGFSRSSTEKSGNEFRKLRKLIWLDLPEGRIGPANNSLNHVFFSFIHCGTGYRIWESVCSN